MENSFKPFFFNVAWDFLYFKNFSLPKIDRHHKSQTTWKFSRILEKIRIFQGAHIFWAIAWKNILKFPQETQTFSVV